MVKLKIEFGITSYLSFIYQFVMLLAFISNWSLGFTTARRVVIMIALFTIVTKWGKTKRVFKLISKFRIAVSLILLGGCLLITFFHTYGLVGSPNKTFFTPRDVITLAVGVLSVGFWCALEVKSLNRFIGLIVAFIIFQTLSVYIAAIYQPYRQLVAEYFFDESYNTKAEAVIYGYASRMRIPGFGIASSGGSLILAYSCLSLVFLKIKGKISELWYGILYAGVIGATALMGRTGLIVEIILIVYYVFYNYEIKKSMTLFIVTIIGVFAVNQILSFMDNTAAEVTKAWILEFTKRDEVMRINGQIVDSGFPPFNTDFIFGTGVMLGRTHGYTFTADSGYIRSYTSIGIVGMFCYYLGMLFLIWSTMPNNFYKDMKNLLKLGILVLFIVEYKEPYIGMMVNPWQLFSLGLLLNVETKNKKYADTYSR